MQASAVVRASFDASHVLTELPRCDRLHGHRWDVAVTFENEIDPKTISPRGSDGLAPALAGLLVEVDHRDLGEMLPAVRPTVTGVALWIMERLSMGHGRIVEVSVSDGHLEARVRREVRTL